MKETNRRALIYCRVSTKKQQEEGHGLESQELRCREYASRKRYEVEHAFHDSFTGGGDFADRPAMQALLAYLDEHAGTDYVVIFDDLKRFARDVRFHWQLRTELSARNATVECPNFRFEETPEGEFIETILAAQGELERKQNRRQTVQKMKARLTAGYWPFHHPPGYRYAHRAGYGKLLVPVEPEASTIAEALEGFAAGRFASQLEVQQFLSAREFRSRVHPSQVRRILTRVLYAGYVEHEPWGIPRRPGAHEGLISLDTFERVQKRLRQRAPMRLRLDYRPEFPLRGFALCGTCGRSLTASFSRGRGGLYPYYRCTDRTCPLYSKSIPKAAIETDFERELQNIAPHPRVLRFTHAIARQAWEERVEGLGGARDLWEQKHTLCEDELERLAARAARTTNERLLLAYERRIAELEKTLQILTERISRKETISPDFGTALGAVLNFVKSPYAAWNSGIDDDRPLLLNIAFDGPASYDRNSGFGTLVLSPGLAIFQEIQTTCFRNVQDPDKSWNPQINQAKEIVAGKWDTFTRWILDSYDRILTAATDSRVELRWKTAVQPSDTA